MPDKSSSMSDVPLTAIVVDDEPLARDGLAALLDEIGVRVAEKCATGQGAIDAIARHRPDVVFLDIEMPGISGLDVIRHVGIDDMPFVVFTTAYEKYAVDAFSAHAIEYLLKPFSETQLREAVSRARAAVSEHRLADLGRKLMAAVPDLAASAGLRIAVRNAGSVTFVPASDVDWVEGADYYAKLHVAGKTHLLRETLSSLEQRLSPLHFLRVHRSAIVNVDRVREIRSVNDGDTVAVLNDGTRVPLSRGNRARLEALLLRSS